MCVVGSVLLPVGDCYKLKVKKYLFTRLLVPSTVAIVSARVKEMSTMETAV